MNRIVNETTEPDPIAPSRTDWRRILWDSGSMHLMMLLGLCLAVLVLNSIVLDAASP